MSPTGQKGRTGPVWFKEKTEPVQPLYKGLGPVFSFLKALSLSSSFFSLLFPPFRSSLRPRTPPGAAAAGGATVPEQLKSPLFFLPLEPSSLTRYESEVRFRKTQRGKPRSKLKTDRILPFSFVFGWAETALGW